MRRAFLLASVVVGGAFLPACNAILEFDSYAVRDGDGADDADECTTNQECTDRYGGDHWVCRKTDGTCVDLLSPECSNILGNWKSDDAIILGAIHPLFGVDKIRGAEYENALQIAVGDFAQGGPGLPPVEGSGQRRPLAIVSCTETAEDENDRDAPLRSADHLIGIGVPAIIGAAYSGNTLRVSEKTVPAGVLLISPSATSVALTDLQDNGLVWRTSPSDVHQASALTGIMPQIEAMARARAGLADSDPLRVWVLHKSDPYGQGLADALSGSLTFNGKPSVDQPDHFVVREYGDPDSLNPPPSYSEQKAALETAIGEGAEPHVIFLFGTTEVVPELLAGIEALDWQGKAKPIYLFADGGHTPELWGLIGNDTDLRTRVFGTTPGTDSANFRKFQVHYRSKIGAFPTIGHAPNAYDALYVVAYSIASLGNQPVTGANIAQGMRHLVPPGQVVEPGATNVNRAFTILASGQNIDYDGASGPLDFDLQKGEAASDVQIWCVPEKDGVAAPATSSGVFYSAAQGGMGELMLYPASAAVASACTIP